MNTEPLESEFEQVIRDLNKVAEMHSRGAKPKPIRASARPRTITKSFTVLSREMDRIAARQAKQINTGWTARIAAGKPTEADLLKAHAVLNDSIGQIPTAELNAMDFKLRALEASLRQSNARTMAKSITAEASVDIPKAHAQLDSLYESGQIDGRTYLRGDFKLRQLEACING
jgi:hypothetical protein